MQRSALQRLCLVSVICLEHRRSLVLILGVYELFSRVTVGAFIFPVLSQSAFEGFYGWSVDDNLFMCGDFLSFKDIDPSLGESLRL